MNTQTSIATDALHLMAQGHIQAAELFLADKLKAMTQAQRESQDGFRLMRALNWLEHGHPAQAAMVLGEPSRAQEQAFADYTARLRRQGVRSQWEVAT